MRGLTPTGLAVVLGLMLIGPATPAAQIGSSEAIRPGPLTIAARSASELSESDALVARMTQSQELVVTDARDDAALPGRRLESFAQLYRGIPVHGGGVTRQTVGGVTVSIFGTLHIGIDIDPVPGLSIDDAAAVIRQLSSSDLAFGQTPRLVVVPRFRTGYSLAYRATMRNQITYFIDARTGALLKSVRERRDQSGVGVGTGALGDVKKISTTRVDGTFRTDDQLRPAGIQTLDTRGAEFVLDRMLDAGLAFDGDFPTDADNSWADPRVVDAHVHTGWTHDYFHKRHLWRGLNGFGLRLTTIVHSPLRNNAFFIPPPFGPGRIGATVFGDTSSGAPMSSLDVTAHEVMHGITHYALLQRTGDGLGDGLYPDRFGPTSFTTNGLVQSCDTAKVTFSDGSQFPFLCDNGRFVLASNHSGALNEAFSDIFGSSVEFFFQPPGTGPLTADYRMAEDIAGLGLIRALDIPSTVVIPTNSSFLPYPDHQNRLLSFAVVLISGTQADPDIIDLAPIVFFDGVPFFTFGLDDGGVHWNSTAFSHAFYLAIEGGRNATSGVTVQGVGPQNRDQMERIFFRAMTQLVPSSSSLQAAALAVRQSAVDLFGSSSQAARAVSDAMVAVGLIAP